MVKKLFRSTLKLIFGALVVANLLLAYAPATAVADEVVVEASGTIFTSPGGVTVCICSGDKCLACVTV